MPLRLDWPANPPSELVTAYRVLESENGAPFVTKAIVPTNTLTFNPAPGNYAWKVRAANFVGEGPESPVVNGPDVPTAPGQPTLTYVPPAP